MKEAQKTSALLKKIRERHPSWFVLKNNQRLTGGIPDAIVVRDRGRHVWIEFKVEGNTLTDLQKRTAARLVYTGAEVLQVTFIHEGKHQHVVAINADGSFGGFEMTGKNVLIDWLEGRTGPYTQGPYVERGGA